MHSIHAGHLSFFVCVLVTKTLSWCRPNLSYDIYYWKSGPYISFHLEASISSVNYLIMTSHYGSH